MAPTHWTEDEKGQAFRLQQQDDLFDDSDKGSVAQLRKLPFDFHYRYEYRTPAGTSEYRHKIVDWDIGALYLNVPA